MSKQEEKIFNFQKSLKRGKKGEQQFFDLFADKLELADGYVHDMSVKRTSKTVELKTDSYDPSKTANFFMERFSYNDEPGGPWQAFKKGVDYYVYWFPLCNMIYCFKTKDLVRELDKLCDGQYLINVRNTSHVTRGYVVARHLLDHINIPFEEVI
jgi:hypothetical protein